MAEEYNVSELLSNISKYRFNPAAIQRESIRMITAVSAGEIQLVDPTNPVVLCLEMSAVNTAAFMVEHEAECRRRYPKLAQTQDDLYLHMSDKDYINRFATPAKAKFSFLFNKERLLASMRDDEVTGYRKVVIPRNTFFTVGGMQFSIQYPIEISQQAHGGIQIVYDTNKPSPLQTLETNFIDYEPLTNSEGEWISFAVDTMQFSVETQQESITVAKDFKMTLPLADKFYHARVYHQNASGGWDEIVTTHSDTVYDAKTPTAVLRVNNTTLVVKIPQVYVSTGLLSRKIRVDVYQTKGAVNIALGEYNVNSVSITYRSIDEADFTIFTAPLPNLQVIGYSTDTVIDGANGMDFDTLRTNVIQNTTGPVDNSITPTQIKTALSNKGYDVVTNVDNITNRVFLATRSMPLPNVVAPTTSVDKDKELLTAAAATIETLAISTNELALYPTVVNNGTSLTITPKTLYQVTNGVTKPVLNSVVQALLDLPVDKRALAVSNGNYLFTPFHYVLDMTNNTFEMRPYYLDSPTIQSKVFVRQNDTTLMQVTTGKYDIYRNENGYELFVQTKSGDAYKALDESKLFAQLSFVPDGERDRAYLNGTLVGTTEEGERIFAFDLRTNFNVDRDDNLELTEFTMYNTDPRVVAAPLLASFDIFYATSEVMTSVWTPNLIDQELGLYLLPNQIAGITHERLRIRFGHALSMLWTRARTVLGSTPYKTWGADIPAYYKEDIYELDSNGSAFKIVDGEIVYNILHRKGDPVLDAEGLPVYEHRKGDVVQEDGKPVPAEPRGLLRQMDLFLLEGVYWFATDITTVDYRRRLTDALVKWLVSDLESFTGKLLDLTRIYFYPKITAGVVPVRIADNAVKSLPAAQTFTVTLAVSKLVYDNQDLRDRLTRSAINTLASALTQKTVAMSKVVEDMRSAFGSDVIDVQLSGLGGAENYSVLTVVDETDRLSIRKRLVALADDTLAVEEDIVINFVEHKQ